MVCSSRRWCFRIERNYHCTSYILVPPVSIVSLVVCKLQGAGDVQGVNASAKAQRLNASEAVAMQTMGPCKDTLHQEDVLCLLNSLFNVD